MALLVGLTPALVASLVVFSWSAVARLGLAAGAAVFVELITQRLMRQPVRIGDFSAVGQGLLLALLLPPSVSWWVLLIGVIVMIVVGKQIFGGVGGYPLNPVLIGWTALLLSWGNKIHPVGERALLGTAWVPAVFIGGALLLVTGHIKWQAPLGMMVGLAVATQLLSLTYPALGTPAEQLATGSSFLGAFFLATDTTTTPANSLSRLLFGVGAGVLVILLRLWGTWPEPVPFALLLMNLTTPLLDRIRPKPERMVELHA